MDDYITIYELKYDDNHIKITQDASLHRDNCGLVTEPALFGSSEWWCLVGTDRLPRHTQEGTITRVYMSGHNDFPEFEMDDGHEKTKWMRQGDDSAYTVGRKIRIQYVEMLFKRRVKGLGDKSKCVLTIEVGP
jgi:hypothetical protein